MVRPTVNSEKHILQFQEDEIATVAKQNLSLVNAVAVPTAIDEVREGSIVKAVFVEMWLKSASTTSVSMVTALEKLVAGQVSGSITTFNLLNDYLNKKNVLYITQGLVGDFDTNPIPVMRGWFKIPKGKQRMALGDTINLSISNNGSVGMLRCGVVIFKEYF